MSTQRILAALFQKCGKAIIFIASLAIVFAGAAVWFYWSYWATVFGDSWGWFEKLSGYSRVSFAFAVTTPFIFWFIRWLIARRDNTMKHEFYNEVVKPAIGTGLVYLLVLVFYTAFIAQPKMYSEKAGEANMASNALAKLTPLGVHTSYRVLAEKLAESEANNQKERDGRIEAEAQVRLEKQHRLDSLLTFSNFWSIIPVLDREIAIAQKDLAAMNSSSNSAIAEIIKKQTEIKKLQTKKNDEIPREGFGHYSSMVHYAISAFEKRFSATVAKCGGNLAPFHPMPPEQWWLSASGSQTNTVSTNCGVIFTYTYKSRGDHTTIISVHGGKNILPARVEFIYSGAPAFHSRIYVGEDYSEWKGSALMDKVACIKDVDYIIGRFFEYQKEEFQ